MPPLRICFISDSFVNGVGDDDGLGWTRRVVARLRGEGVDVTGYELREGSRSHGKAPARGHSSRVVDTERTGRPVILDALEAGATHDEPGVVVPGGASLDVGKGRAERADGAFGTERIMSTTWHSGSTRPDNARKAEADQVLPGVDSRQRLAARNRQEVDR